MAKCGDCSHFDICRHYVEPDETFPEVGGCSAFKNKGDFMEVVRCKDCVWCEKGKGYEPYCNHPTDGMSDVQLDDFCSYGERREGE